MPRSQPPRRRYAPKRVDSDPVGLAMAHAALLQPQQQADLINPLRAAFEALRRGQGNQNAWCAMADAMNIAEALADLGIANDHAELIQRAQAALAALHQRHQTNRSWTLRAAELDALRDASEIHEIQIEHATQGEVANAIATVRSSGPAGAATACTTPTGA